MQNLGEIFAQDQIPSIQSKREIDTQVIRNEFSVNKILCYVWKLNKVRDVVKTDHSLVQKKVKKYQGNFKRPTGDKV